MKNWELENLSPEQKLEQIRQRMINELGSKIHNEWRASRKKEDGSYEPRWKKTTDEKWIKEHRTNEVDIANTSFTELPADWQAENKAAAEVVMGEVFRAVENRQDLNETFVEKASSVVHDEWIKRNKGWVSEELKKPFEELPEVEKEKDRTQVRKAIKIYRTTI